MRSLVFSLIEKFNTNIVGPAYKRYGRKLYEFGTKFEGELASEDRLVPSLRKVEHNGKIPEINHADFIAPNATIAGDVTIGQNSSVWYSATLIGSLPIRVGNNSIIQDRAYISRQTTIGNYCFVGPNAVLQGATLGNRAFVGMGSTVRHATIEEGGVVAGGAVILDNVTVKTNELWAGNPAQYVRNITPTERQIMRQHHQQQQLLAKIHEQQANKPFRELISQEVTISRVRIEEYITQNIDDWDIPSEMEDWNFVQQRLLMKESIIKPEDRISEDPYQQDMKKFPEDFNLGDNKAVFGQVRTRMHKEPHWESKNVNSPYKQKI